MYLLDNADATKWCSFGNRSVWKGKIDLLRSSDVAILHYNSKRLSSIEFTQESDSGDWIVYDIYIVEDGHLVKLNRRSNILPGDVSVKQVFRIQEGKSVLESTAVLGLRTGKPSSAHDFLLPEVPVVQTLADFPFATLLNTNYVEPHNGTCAPANDNVSVQKK